MRYKWAQFMAGRNGSDALARFLSIVALIALLLSYIVSRGNAAGWRGYISVLFWIAAMVLLFLSYVRIFSKKLDLRYKQNQAYLRKTAKIRGYIASKKAHFSQRKEYRFFNCPSCKATMRVPKGKGKIKIVCRKCGEAFVRKT